MKLQFSALILAIAGPSVTAQRRDRGLLLKRKLTSNPLMSGGANPSVTFEPGCFNFGDHIYDEDSKRIRVSNGLRGRAIAYVGKPVQFADGTNSTVPLHLNPDGAALFPKKDGGFYYASNSEEGSLEDLEFTGGVYVIETDAEHNPIDYYMVLNGTINNCAGGPTPWGTWVSCEEEDGYGHCWQTDPANKDQTGPTKSQMTNVTGYPGGWEAFAWDDEDSPPRGYVTDDCEIEDAPLCWGTLNRFTPDAKAMDCYNGKTKAEKWCTLNSGTHDYLKLNPYVNGGNCGTISWVDTPEESSAADFRKNEGIDITDRILRFVAKKDHLLLEIDLVDQTYCKWSTLEGFQQQPDNIRYLGDSLYYCTDGRTPNGVWALNKVGYYPLLHEIDYQSELAGIDFTPDGMYMYVAFQTSAIWQFWRADGLPFHAPVAKVCYHHDDGAVQDMDEVLEPYIQGLSKEVCEELLTETLNPPNETETEEAAAEVAVQKKKTGPVGRKFKKLHGE